MKIGCNMTQRIFKKSNKQDMIDLFNMLPNWVDYITQDGGDYGEYYIEMHQYKPSFTFDGFNHYWKSTNESITHELDILNIDFETDKVEEMIIKRPMEEDNDK